MFNLVDDDSTIIVGTGKEIQVKKKGELIRIHRTTQQKIHLHNVLYMPSFKQNIMNIPILIKNGFQPTLIRLCHKSIRGMRHNYPKLIITHT